MALGLAWECLSGRLLKQSMKGNSSRTRGMVRESTLMPKALQMRAAGRRMLELESLPSLMEINIGSSVTLVEG